jgi:hypothetical protein
MVIHLLLRFRRFSSSRFWLLRCVLRSFRYRCFYRFASRLSLLRLQSKHERIFQTTSPRSPKLVLCSLFDNIVQTQLSASSYRFSRRLRCCFSRQNRDSGGILFCMVCRLRMILGLCSDALRAQSLDHLCGSQSRVFCPAMYTFAGMFRRYASVRLSSFRRRFGEQV